MTFLSVFPCSQTLSLIFFSFITIFFGCYHKSEKFSSELVSSFFRFLCVFSVLFHFHSFCRKNFNFEWRAGIEIFSRTLHDGGFWGREDKVVLLRMCSRDRKHFFRLHSDYRMKKFKF